jgi:hypothetical protein
MQNDFLVFRKPLRSWVSSLTWTVAVCSALSAVFLPVYVHTFSEGHRELFLLWVWSVFWLRGIRDSSVNIVIRLRAGQSMFDSQQRQRRYFIFATAPRPALGPTQPPIKWVLGTLSSGVKRPGRETLLSTRKNCTLLVTMQVDNILSSRVLDKPRK